MNTSNLSYVLTPAYQVVREVPWTVAMSMIMADEAWSLRDRDGQFIHSQHLTIPKPMWVVRRKFSTEEYLWLIELDRERASFEAVMRRDKGRCGYCTRKATTIDHIIPQSHPKSPGNVWNNLVACCVECNQFKADRTPEQAGMRLLGNPAAHDPLEKVQRQVWRWIDHLSGEEFAMLDHPSV